jgi:hypothetical protein
MVEKVNIETVEDLKRALKDVGYSNKAITEIMKWYTSKKPPMT